jgi:hypothetical protein
MTADWMSRRRLNRLLFDVNQEPLILVYLLLGYFQWAARVHDMSSMIAQVARLTLLSYSSILIETALQTFDQV